MTEIRPGMSVRLVKAPALWVPIQFNQLFGETGIVMGFEQSIATGFDRLYQVQFRSGAYWLSGRNIEPTSPAGVQIERPTMREAGFYWLRDDEGWHPAQWDVVCGCGRWWVLGCELPYNDDEFDEIGPRIEVPEGLK